MIGKALSHVANVMKLLFFLISMLVYVRGIRLGDCPLSKVLVRDTLRSKW